MRVRLLGTLLIGAALVGACGGGDDEASSATTSPEAEEATTTTAPADDETTTTTLSPEGEVVAAYEAATAAFLAALDPPNPEHPDLLSTRTGDSLSRTQSNLSQLAAQGVVGRGTIDPSVTDVRIDGDEATFVDCYREQSQVYRASDGAAVGEPTDAVVHLDVTMTLVDGRWRLSNTQIRTDPCEPSA